MKKSILVLFSVNPIPLLEKSLLSVEEYINSSCGRLL